MSLSAEFRSRCLQTRAGHSLAEFALFFPLLLLIMLGGVDFGRLFFHGVTVANAAGAGAFFGARSNIAAGDFSGMQTSASNDSADIVGASSTADQHCRCPDGVEVACEDIATTTCAGYGTPRAYVRVRVDQSFETFGAYPWIPNQTAVSRRVWMRVR